MVASFVAAVAPTELKDSLRACAQKPFHLIFGARREPADGLASRVSDLECRKMQVEARGGHDGRRFYFDELALGEEASNRREQGRAELEDLKHCGISGL